MVPWTRNHYQRSRRQLSGGYGRSPKDRDEAQGGRTGSATGGEVAGQVVAGGLGRLAPHRSGRSACTCPWRWSWKPELQSSRWHWLLDCHATMRWFTVLWSHERRSLWCHCTACRLQSEQMNREKQKNNIKPKYHDSQYHLERMMAADYTRA